MLNEFGIACILHDESINELNHSFTFIDKSNIPHISLFQFKSNSNQLVELLTKELTNINTPLTLQTSDIFVYENNIFLNILDEGYFKKSSDYISNYFYSNNDHIEPLSQINVSELNADQKYLVDKYGIYWIQENYQPHITLCYEDTNMQTENNINIPTFIKIHPPQIYPIDSLGRILK